MAKLNIQSIQYFLKVAKTLNFTEAAKELYISQPALSKQIRQLEEELDLQLLRRDTKGVELTEAGKIMYNTWNDLLHQADDAIERARLSNTQKLRKLRIGLLEMGGVIDTVVPFLEGYDELHDNLEIEYQAYGFKELKEKLKNHELDVIFSFSSELPNAGTGISFQMLKELELNIIVPKKNHLYEKDSINFSELKNETFYVFGSTYSDEGRRSILEHCKKNGFYPKKIKNFPNVTSMSIALSCGSGITMGYRVFFREMDNQFKFFPIQQEIGKHYIVVAWEEAENDVVTDLIKFLGENM